VNQERTVAVVIPSWNSLELLPRCLASLQQQGLGLETLVVDNGSTDGTVVFLEREGVPHLSLPRNLGFARAMNLGAARVRAEAILALNADTVLEPGAVAVLHEALAADPGLAGVQPRILQLEEERQGEPRLYSAGQGLTADGRAVELGAGEPASDSRSAPREVFGVCGAACLLRRELFDRLGGYDERYFSFYEDVDLNVRARILGRRFAYVPEAVVWHVGNASWTAQAPRPGAWNARLVARNRIATQAKFLPVRALPRVLLVELGALGRAARQGRFRATLRGKLEGLSRLPAVLSERRRLAREGELGRARRWLGREGL
jgi:N-acetylglucosaminyl-diphospho-decaprenol L-rhamnosyltransferase